MIQIPIFPAGRKQDVRIKDENRVHYVPLPSLNSSNRYFGVAVNGLLQSYIHRLSNRFTS